MKIEITDPKIAIAVCIGIGFVILVCTHAKDVMAVLPAVVKSVLGR